MRPIWHGRCRKRFRSGTFGEDVDFVASSVAWGGAVEVKSTVEHDPRWDIASLSMEFLLGDYLEDERVTFYRAWKCAIESSPPIDFAADGEAIATTPVTFEIEKQAIRVISDM